VRTGVNKGSVVKTTYFYNVISHKSFYTLPPDEFGKTYSDKELKCSVPNNSNGLKRYFPKVIEKKRLEVDVVREEDLDVTTPAATIPEARITEEGKEEQKFAIDATFHQSDPRYEVKPDLLKKCVEQGILHHYLEDRNGKRKGQVMIVSNIWMMVHKFYLE
jgi:hypothetical protein